MNTCLRTYQKKFERNRSARTEVISEKPIVGYHRVPCRVEGTKLKLLSHLNGNLYVIKGEEFKFRFSFNKRVPLSGVGYQIEVSKGY